MEIINNRFILGECSKEIFIPQKTSAGFEKLSIRMAGITKACDKYLCARRKPDHHTVLFVTSGQGQVSCDNQTIDLPTSSMLLLKEGVDFSYHQTANHWSFAWFILEPTTIWRHLYDLPMLLGHGTHNQQVKHMLHLLALGISIETKQILDKNICDILQKTLDDNEKLTSKNIAKDSRLIQLFLDVEHQLHFPWTSKVLANKLHVSEPTLHRLCNGLYQQSPRQKIIALRMNRTAFLLNNSDWPLSVIAEQVGYKDAFSLSKMFKKSQGISPDNYRKVTDATRR